MDITMNAILEFDRDILPNKHYISPGSYTLLIAEKKVTFDFNYYIGTIDKNNPKKLHISTSEIDEAYGNPQDLFLLTKKLPVSIIDFFLYTGEDDEPEINLVNICKLEFVINGNLYQIPKQTLSKY